MTEKIVEHIERKNSYFAFVLSKSDALSFQDREPANKVMVRAILSSVNNDDQKKALEM